MSHGIDPPGLMPLASAIVFGDCRMSQAGTVLLWSILKDRDGIQHRQRLGYCHQAEVMCVLSL